MELSFLRRTIQSKNGDDHRALLMLIFSFSSFVELNFVVQVEQKAIPTELSVPNANITWCMCIIQ